jgi:hypothetical protein
MNQKRAKNPMLPHAKLARSSLDFWASPPKWSILKDFLLEKTSQTIS